MGERRQPSGSSRDEARQQGSDQTSGQRKKPLPFEGAPRPQQHAKAQGQPPQVIELTYPHVHEEGHHAGALDEGAGHQATPARARELAAKPHARDSGEGHVQQDQHIAQRDHVEKWQHHSHLKPRLG